MTEHRNRGRHLPGAAARYAGLLVVPILGLGLVACGGSGEPALRTRPLPRRNSSGPSAPVMRQPRAALAPESRNEVAESGKSACANAISEVELTPGARPYGRCLRSARAGRPYLGLFLSQFAGGWKIVAAGCRPRTGHPYQCLIKGG